LTYWILANPTDDNLGGFEFGWAFSPAILPAPLILSTTLPPFSLNIGTDYNLMVGRGGGLVTTAATVLVSFNLKTLGPVDGPTYITAGPATPASIPGHAVAHTFDNMGEMYPIDFSTVDDLTVIVDNAGWELPGVAKMTCPLPMATETATWSGVKALFRDATR
jgi:hypothetical protein